jgi:hypothetical protein
VANQAYKRQITSPELEWAIKQNAVEPEDAFQLREFSTFLHMVKRRPGTALPREVRDRIIKRFGRKWLGLDKSS